MNATRTAVQRCLATGALAAALCAMCAAAEPVAHTQAAQPGELRVGDKAPEFTLPTYASLLAATNAAAPAATNVTLSAARSTQPVVLIFSSYT